jgi:hypothetical protein
VDPPADVVTADPTITGIVTNDGDFEFVEVLIDYAYNSTLGFNVDDIVKVTPLAGQHGIGTFTAIPRASQLNLNSETKVGVQVRLRPR